MRLANLAGRAVLVQDGKALDVERASEGRFGPDPMSPWSDWAAFTEWARTADYAGAEEYAESDLGAPIPFPRQVFAIGLNYKDHADEAEMAYPDNIVVFTKYQSSLAGPTAEVKVPGETVDWEAELVVVVGQEIHDVDEDAAQAAIAGYSVGQDFSERTVQRRPPAPQFSLGKSFPGFGPFGPAVVSPDELEDPANLSITCVIEGPTGQAQSDGEGAWTAQDGNTKDMIFSSARILSDLSRVVTLYPGDIVFTGTPAGVGMPQGIALQPGDVVTTSIEGIGSLRNAFV